MRPNPAAKFPQSSQLTDIVSGFEFQPATFNFQQSTLSSSVRHRGTTEGEQPFMIYEPKI